MGGLTGSVRDLAVRAAWWCGARIGHRGRRLVCRLGAGALAPLPMRGLRRWEANHRRALGEPATARDRRRLLESWLGSVLISPALERWGAGEVTARAIVAPHHRERLRRSLAGPGLVLAVPHLGSWDFVAVWCATQGMPVAMVTDPLPRHAFERLRAARAVSGVELVAPEAPDLLDRLATGVRAGRMALLLADRDGSGAGVDVPWPTDDHPAVVRVPRLPALLAARTGADLRVAAAAFRDDGIEIVVSERIEVGPVRETMTDVVAAFAEGVERAPTSWLMLQQAFRD